MSDNDGEFVYKPLPAGVYEVTANTVEGLWAAGAKVEVKPGKGAAAQPRFKLQPPERRVCAQRQKGSHLKPLTMPKPTVVQAD